MSADDDFRLELEAINAEYRQSLPQRLADIDAAWSAISRGSADAATLHALLRSLHSIAGSASTFGLPALGAAAAAAEDWIEPYDQRREPPDASAREAFEPLLAAVRQAASA